MKKILIVTALLLAAVAARANIVTNVETASNLDLSFTLKDGFQLWNDSAATETYNLTVFPGESVTFYFKDGVYGFGGDHENFSTVPASAGLYTFNKDDGWLNFSGTYNVDSTVVNWSIQSKVTTALFKDDTWSGTLTATASSSRVPDSGATMALFGLGLVALGVARRKIA